MTAPSGPDGPTSASRPWPAGDEGADDAGAGLLFDDILDVVAAASLGDLGSRIEIAPDALDEPLELVANAVNMLLDDLAYRQAEREEALRQVAASEAKEEFLASLSHDMQTPLAIILGAIHVLDATNSASHLESTLPLLRAAAHRLQRFVQQFLDLARLEAHEVLVVRPVPLEVAAIVHRTIELFVEYPAVEVDIPADIPRVLADPERFEQILANLLSNAFSYASAPTVTARTDGSTVTIEVTDRGPGMTEAELQRAFGKFERINSQKGPSGTGLGLFISRAMAEAQGGRLTGHSVLGEGCRFVLRLPAVGEVEAP